MISFCVGFPPVELISPPSHCQFGWIVKASFKQQSQWEMGGVVDEGELVQQRKKNRLSNGILHVICIFHWQMIWLGCKFDNFKWQWQLLPPSLPQQLPSPVLELHPIQRLQLQLLLQFMHSSGSTADDDDEDGDDDEAAGSSCI